MTTLSLAARNLAAQDPAVTALLGSSTNWATWIFSDQPYVTIENKQKVMVVITENGNHSSPNLHNTMRFPRMLVDIWADPTRNSDNSVKTPDAKDKIEAVVKVLNRLFHTVDNSDSRGMPLIWGTQAQIASKTGVVVLGSTQLNGPEFSPVSDSNGAWMGRVTYGVNLA